MTEDWDVQDFIEFYNEKITEMQQIENGGQIRSLKGTLVENLAESASPPIASFRKYNG